MLYALPDHEVMENLLPGIRDRYLPVVDALERIQSQPGLVPVAVNPHGNGLVYFADIGDTPLLEWKHIYTIERLAQDNAIGEIFTTDLEILLHDELSTGCLPPRGLIFHVSRCGSTLFTKALARSPRNLVVIQGGPLQEGFWAAITDHWQHPPELNERNINMLRNLVMLMARKHRPEYEHCFLKLISWNVIYMDLICAAFPDAPALYLYRDPVEVIANVLQETTAALSAKGDLLAGELTGLSPQATAKMSNVEYLAHCYAHYFSVVLDKSEGIDLHLVNYEQLRHSKAFAYILAQGLNLHPESAELELMQKQYLYYSKDDTDTTLFTGDIDSMLDILPSNDKQIIKRVCNDAFVRLNTSKHNIYKAASTR
jgi:hypothetical protein